MEIVRYMDMHSIWRLREVSIAARDLVHSSREYRVVREEKELVDATVCFMADFTGGRQSADLAGGSWRITSSVAAACLSGVVSDSILEVERNRVVVRR
ncbi:unnamed protein product [Penicillium bialowiezense]